MQQDPAVPVFPPQGLILIPKGKGGAVLTCWGSPPAQQQGDMAAPGQGALPGRRLAGPLFSTSRPPLGIEEHLSAGPEIKQYMGNSSGSGSGESPGHGPVPQQKEVSLRPGRECPRPER